MTCKTCRFFEKFRTKKVIDSLGVFKEGEPNDGHCLLWGVSVKESGFCKYHKGVEAGA